MKYSNDPKLPVLLKEFLQHIYVVKNKSTLTVEEYCLDIKLFLKFLKREKGLTPSSSAVEDVDISDIDISFIKDITLLDAYTFLSYCREQRNNDSAARARKVSSIRAFFKYLSVHLRPPPMADILMIPKGRPAVKPVQNAGPR